MRYDNPDTNSDGIFRGPDNTKIQLALLLLYAVVPLKGYLSDRMVIYLCFDRILLRFFGNTLFTACEPIRNLIIL